MTSLVKIARVRVGADFDDASASALKMAGVIASACDAEIPNVPCPESPRLTPGPMSSELSPGVVGFGRWISHAQASAGVHRPGS